MKRQIKPTLEVLEDRCTPSAANVANVAALQVELNAIVPVIQQDLRILVNSIPQLDTPQNQAFVNAFPALAESWFQQQVMAQEQIPQGQWYNKSGYATGTTGGRSPANFGSPAKPASGLYVNGGSITI